jgi:6-phosphogluconate dehydrogenase
VPLSVDKNKFLIELEQAFYFTMIMSYAQGMHLLSKASAEYKYGLHLAEIAKIWRGGCIIRSGFLNEIFTAYEKDNNLQHLLLDEGVQKLAMENLPGIRSVLSKAITAGIAMPAYAASLSYFDNLRNKQMPSNLIQAQRDYFGAHTYELIGKEGVFHTKWGEKSISIKGSGVKEKQ